jgi:hypothetical protein
MIQKLANAKEALIQSYTKPIAFKNYILFNGIVIVRFVNTA